VNIPPVAFDLLLDIDLLDEQVGIDLNGLTSIKSILRSKMSLKLCATSRDMMTVFLPISAARIPVAAATDVFPVPPFPAKNMILTDELLPCYTSWFQIRGIKTG
jgi:hypothetical protein